MQEIIELEKWLQTNKEYILNTLSELIQINTVNLPPGGNEKPGQDYIYNKISRYIPDKDIDIFEIDDVAGIRQNPFFFSTIDGVEKEYNGRPNLVAKLKGSGGSSSLAFSGHIDTMPDYGKKWSIFEGPYSGK